VSGLPRKVYLVYDYEEFCGVYSSFSLAKKAVERHLGIVKDFAERQAKSRKLGELAYELRQAAGERTWVYSLLVKEKESGLDLHCRRPIIYECPLDQYDSMTKRMNELAKKQ